MKYLTLLFLLFCIATAQAEPFSKGDAAAGKKFFDQNQCNRCHDNIMGGDGNKIFTRFNRKVKNPEQMIDQLHMCSSNAGITLTPQDEQNLGAYLSKTYYHFK
jgi:cytochrome c553